MPTRHGSGGRPAGDADASAEQLYYYWVVWVAGLTLGPVEMFSFHLIAQMSPMWPRALAFMGFIFGGLTRRVSAV